MADPQAAAVNDLMAFGAAIPGDPGDVPEDVGEQPAWASGVPGADAAAPNFGSRPAFIAWFLALFFNTFCQPNGTTVQKATWRRFWAVNWHLTPAEAKALHNQNPVFPAPGETGGAEGLWLSDWDRNGQR